MSNHFHLVVETPRGNLVDGILWLLGVYTNRFNHRHKEFGHLFSGRYKALLVEGSGNAQAKAERIIREGLAALGGNADDLRRHRKSHASKARIAERLRRETTMTLSWIAEQLCMGSGGHVSHLFYRNKSNPEEAEGQEGQKKLF
jgi:hypothetical protein